MSRAVAALLGAALLLPGVARAADGGVTLKDGWIRLLIRARPAAGYFTLDNAADTAKVLTGATSPDCEQLMLHQSLHESGEERMVMVQQVAVPAHGSLSFAPGGYHLMCMQPRAAMKIGGAVPVTLRFADGGTVAADFLVKGVAGP